MVSFGDSASGVFGQFDEYSRLLILVARGLFDGAVQLPPPRRFLLDGNDSFDFIPSSPFYPVCDLNNREDGSLVNGFFIGMALFDGRVLLNLPSIAGRR
ncbi:hypothetical protein DY000_02050579 [Brassica cretica]|uniref:Xylanase inhibitor C-terminal domain-containing protein n=1 Tax=Brassica cretica TaxID=69181 RepID=A0ABQ7F186_BRACR|nr:hypothetical protein DY000_02050579 [Brassica cretica]